MLVKLNLKSFHEGLCSGLCDGAKVVHEVSLGHANAGVHDGERLRSLVRDDLYVELLSGLQLGRVRQCLVADLVKSIRRVGDQLTKEDFLPMLQCLMDLEMM